MRVSRRPKYTFAHAFVPAQPPLNAVFESIDLVLGPSQSDSVTTTNLTGHPAVVLPGGFVNRLPEAIMLTGKLWDEATILRAAAAFESATDWHTKHPRL